MVEKALTVAAYLVLIGLMAFGLKACRDYRVDSCEDRGGVASAPPWLSADPSGVHCLDPAD